MTHRLCAVLIVVGFALTACETTPLHPRPEIPDNPGVTTEIGKPLALVNQVVPEAVERCGFVIDKRQFVDGVVDLEAASADGARISIRLTSVTPEKTHVEVQPTEGHAPEGIMLQMVNFIRDLVWN
jgi:hypothetical protein